MLFLDPSLKSHKKDKGPGPGQAGLWKLLEVGKRLPSEDIEPINDLKDQKQPNKNSK